nr:MAG TPA: hypothetical protein [Bacteriophage sp.]
MKKYTLELVIRFIQKQPIKQLQSWLKILHLIYT